MDFRIRKYLLDFTNLPFEITSLMVVNLDRVSLNYFPSKSNAELQA